MDPTRHQTPPPSSQPATPWVVTADGKRVGRPTTEAAAKAEVARLNQLREGSGSPGSQFAAKQVLMG